MSQLPGAPRGEREGILPAIVALSLGLAAGIFTLPVVVGLTGSLGGAVVLGAVVVVLTTLASRRWPIVPLEPAACSRGLTILSAVATILALVLLTRLTVFMIDPSKAEYSSVPASRWELEHSCLSAYFVAARAAGRVPNVYADSLYTSAEDTGRGQRKALTIGPFKIDVYEYPPPFLLLPRALRLVVPDFMRLRSLWFGLNCAVILLSILVAARALGRAAGTRALLLSPLVWIALPTLGTLQKGNVQAMVIALAMLAMALFARRSWAAGGALLAYATVSKLYPGMLVVYLLMRRQWRALAWTAVWGVVLCLLTLIDTGPRSYTAFLDHLPGLVGGEAFPAFRNPMAMAINYSVPGLVFKLKLFGVAGMGFGVAKIVGWIYTLVVLAAILVVARRTVREGHQPIVWLAILTLATLRSPFLPQAYAAFPALVLLVLVGATFASSTRTLVAIVATWIALCIFWPLDSPMDPRLLAVISGIPQLVTMVLPVLALRWSTRAVDAATPGLLG